MELAPCHISGTYSFEAVPKFLENVCNPNFAMYCQE